jgi:hypothetical protein
MLRATWPLAGGGSCISFSLSYRDAICFAGRIGRSVNHCDAAPQKVGLGWQKIGLVVSLELIVNDDWNYSLLVGNGL